MDHVKQQSNERCGKRPTNLPELQLRRMVHPTPATAKHQPATHGCCSGTPCREIQAQGQGSRGLNFLPSFLIFMSYLTTHATSLILQWNKKKHQANKLLWNRTSKILSHVDYKFHNPVEITHLQVKMKLATIFNILLLLKSVNGRINANAYNIGGQWYLSNGSITFPLRKQLVTVCFYI